MSSASHFRGSQQTIFDLAKTKTASYKNQIVSCAPDYCTRILGKMSGITAVMVFAL